MESKQELSLGISLLRTFYILNVTLFFLTSLIFFDYLDILILGKILSSMPAAVIRVVLIVLPLYLVFGISYLRKEAYPLAITYHLFFTINGVTTICHRINKNLKLRPLLEIVLKPEYQTTRITDLFGASHYIYIIQILSVAIGLIIIIYLFKKRKIFTA